MVKEMVNMTMKEVITLMRDTFIGDIHVDVALKRFNELIKHTEDFDHENRIYELEGDVKILKKQVEIIKSTLEKWLTDLHRDKLYKEGVEDYFSYLLELLKESERK